MKQLEKNNYFILPSLLLFLKRRLEELLGVSLLLIGMCLFVCILSYDPSDPSINTAFDGPVQNGLGIWGAYIADIMFQSIGWSSIFLTFVFVSWSFLLLSHRPILKFKRKLILTFLGLVFISLALSNMTVFFSTDIPGGVLGNLVAAYLIGLFKFLGLSVNKFIISGVSCLFSVFIFLYVMSIERSKWVVLIRYIFKSVVNLLYCIFSILKGMIYFCYKMLFKSSDQKIFVKDNVKNKKSVSDKKSEPVIKLDSLTVDSIDYQLPPLDLLKQPKESSSQLVVIQKQLKINAEKLKKVLEDFSINGEIVKIRPGPIVTLYELIPAPGIKLSRIVSLSDDIARSMSAISARIAVIPGRNAIGIELPNQTRKTVYLKELLSSEVYERSSSKLTLALGKDISGTSIIVDLAKMPHLLVAGTTGSGKSVSVNAMILSLLYRLPPEHCKFIMIDPKMLELSVYNNIPHLLYPVITDPRKAICALKWVVQEMEKRYRLMSQIGVRNIDGYNFRVSEAKHKGEILMKKVQTGFDADSGKPVFESYPLKLNILPYIVVVVDEMADLMLVAGKDVEAAIQRLAQMARAAGIHLIMATQRPSVDVITGTIKANFPTRISFQVTSKIDSRTILGESGAEQLLGQGDMLYMASGGRIIRVHGPFIQDNDIETVVNFLCKQAQPSYVDNITEDVDDSFQSKSSEKDKDKLYNDAVNVVLQYKRASTSFIQRKLQIGYNRAASIIEQMEEEGVISSANHVGKRNVLASSGK